MWKGGFPELWAHDHVEISQFFDDYIQTYLERDLRMFLNIGDLREFRRFMVAIAMRVGQLVNFTDIAKDVGVSATTIKSWITALEASGIILLLPPFYRNLGKRMIKAPKIYFSDNGILCNLLNISTHKHYQQHLHKGQIWENFVLGEIIKNQPPKPGRGLYFYRDQNGIEIDFVLEKNNQIELIEAKAAERIDERKLNFNKVAPLFTQKTTSMVACIIKEHRPLNMKNYTLYNPLQHF